MTRAATVVMAAACLVLALLGAGPVFLEAMLADGQRHADEVSCPGCVIMQEE